MKIGLDWTVAAAVIAAIALAHQVTTSLIDLNPKGLQLRVASVSQFEAVAQPKLGIELTRAGVPLRNPSIAVLELTNSGGKPIPTADFESKISITAGPAKIVGVSIDSAEPVDLKPTITVVGNALSIEPLLLNPDDKLRLLVLTETEVPSFDMQARISGVKRPTVLLTQTREPEKSIGMLAMGSVMGPLGLILIMLYAREIPATAGSKKAGIVAASTFGLNASMTSAIQLAGLAPAYLQRVAAIAVPVLYLGLMLLAFYVGYLYLRRHIRYGGR